MSNLIEIVDQKTVAVVDEVITIISEGIQGPPGPQGPQGVMGAPGGTLVVRRASETLGGHRAVLVDATGGIAYASADQTTHASRVIGITTGAAVIGDDANIQIYGELVEPSWNWSLDLPIYLGLDGGLTQVPPAQPTSKFSLVVGFPISATSAFINVQLPINIL